MSFRVDARSPGRRWLWLAGLAACALALAWALPGEAAAKTTLSGKAKSANRALGGLSIKVYRAGGANGKATVLGKGRSNRKGNFKVRFREPTSANAVLYVLATGRRGADVLAATLGAPPVASRVVLNERTTVATGFAFAQFITGRSIAGPKPGPQNAATMAPNLAKMRNGKRSSVLTTAPNGGETSTLPTFNSLTNMLPRCVRSQDKCTRLFRLTRVPDGRKSRGVLQAVANITKYPWHNVGGLLKYALSGPAPYGNALSKDERPSAWNLPLRFDGDGMSLDGPGNIAFDAEGRGYVANNYIYSPSATAIVCGADNLPVFLPDGSYAPHSPFTGGGLSGAGYGVTVAPNGNIWVANYGFASPGCPDQPLHNSMTEMQPDGTAKSGASGYVAGDLYWPQGVVPTDEGNLWIANCGNGLVTRMPTDDPNSAVGIDMGLTEAFDVAVNDQGLGFASGLGNSKLAIFDASDGTPQPGSPLSAAEAGLDRPMGVATDSRGNVWIANSGLVNLPCPSANIDPANKGGSISLVKANGTPVTTEGTAFEGGGLTIPWGISVDGNDNVWVSDFAGQRISLLCGMRVKACRPGSEPGDPISPSGRGYFFDGFVRVTAVQTDPAGNLWAANNWKKLPDYLGNPGGYEMVVFVGAAAPLKTPVVGSPQPLLG